MESVNANSLTSRFWCLSLLKSLKENNRSVYRMYHKRLLTQSHTKKSPLRCLKTHIAPGFINSTAQKKRDESFVSREEHRVSRGESLVTEDETLVSQEGF